MKLDQVREKIDAIDPQIRSLLMERLDCSKMVAEAKQEAGETNIYRADREQAILKKLSQGVPEDRLPEYLAVVRKIMETSRMYQYGMLFDWNPQLFAKLAENIEIRPGGTRVVVRLTRPDQQRHEQHPEHGGRLRIQYAVHGTAPFQQTGKDRDL